MDAPKRFNLDQPHESAMPLSTAPLSQFFDGSPVPKFVIDANHIVTHWNKACERITGVPAEEVIGTCDHWKPFYDKMRPVMADLIASGAGEEEIREFYQGKYKRTEFVPGGYEVEDFFPHLGDSGLWLFFSAAPIHDANGRTVGAIETLQDITQRKLAEQELHKARLELEQLVARRTEQLAQANAQLEEDIRKRQDTEAELLRRNAELTELNDRLSKAQEQLMQSEKLASIGQLAAGVAHEINNPIGYIFSNFGSLDQYLDNLFAMLAAYEKAEGAIGVDAVREELIRLKERIELDFLKQDIPLLMSESKEGIVRVRKIVQDLKDFSRIDAKQEWQWANLHQGIDSTLNIVNNEVKYKAEVIKEYGDIPDVECLPSQINQVVMNMVVNAAHAMGDGRGKITIRTGSAADKVWIEIADTGRGIPPENRNRIFEPFFTTKPVGKGTGLGLSLAYGIVRKHGGSIEVESEVGKGTMFRVTLPIRQSGEENKYNHHEGS